MPPRDRTTTLALLLAAAVIATGTVVRAATGGLGTATPPFVMAPGLRVHPLALLAAVVLALAVVLGPRLLDRPRHPAAFAASVFGLALAVAVAVGCARRGVDGLSYVFDLSPEGSFEAKNEYLPGLDALRYGPGFLLDRFAELVPSQTVNVAGHPPLLLLTMDLLGLDTPGELAALCIGAAAACAPLAYALARSLGAAERAARGGGLLAALCPTLVLFGTTSADAVYAALGAGAAALLCARRPVLRVLGLAAFALAAFSTWADLAIGAFAAVVWWRRGGLRAGATIAAGCAVAWLALNGALAALTGWDPIGTLLATEDVYRESVAAERPWWFWVLGGTVAWGTMGGVVTLWWLQAAVRGRNEGALALAAVLAVAALLGFTTAETERIWLPFTALACAAAATAMPPDRVRAALVVCAVQVLAVQLLFETIW